MTQKADNIYHSTIVKPETMPPNRETHRPNKSSQAGIQPETDASLVDKSIKERSTKKKPRRRTVILITGVRILAATLKLE